MWQPLRVLKATRTETRRSEMNNMTSETRQEPSARIEQIYAQLHELSEQRFRANYKTIESARQVLELRKELAEILIKRDELQQIQVIQLSLKRLTERYRAGELTESIFIDLRERLLTPIVNCEKCGLAFSFQEAQAGYTTCENCDAGRRLCAKCGKYPPFGWTEERCFHCWKAENELMWNTERNVEKVARRASGLTGVRE